MNAPILLNQPLTSWIYLLISTIVGLSIGKLVGFGITYQLKTTYKKTGTKLDDVLANSLKAPLTLLAGGAGLFAGLQFLTLTSFYSQLVEKGFRAYVILVGGLFTLAVIDNLQKFYAKVWVRRTASKLDDAMLPLVTKVVKIVVAALFLLSTLNTLGVNTTSVLASFGIGGLAIALGSQDTLSDLFGSLSVFSDKPFRVGDLIKLVIGGKAYVGYVEELTLRSARVRTLEGTVLAIPNRKLAEAIIENLTLSPKRRVILEFDLAPDLTSDTIRKALQMIRKSLIEADYVSGNSRVHLIGMGKRGWQIEVNFVLDEESYTRFNEIREHILFDIQKSLDTSGVKIAF